MSLLETASQRKEPLAEILERIRGACKKAGGLALGTANNQLDIDRRPLESGAALATGTRIPASRSRRLSIYLPYVILIVLELPAVWYALHTPFSLIDDYGDWWIMKDLGAPERASSWLRRTFLQFGGSRFRPLFDLYNYMTWSIFGDNYALHHLLRLVAKWVTAIYGLRILLLFSKQRPGAGWFAALSFLSVFLFFPNAPEARLAPQELNMVLFLSMALFYVATVLTRSETIESPPRSLYARLCLVLLLLAWSKETAVPLLCTIVLLVCLLRPTAAGIVAASPLLLITAYALVKGYFQFHAGGYGTSPVTVQLLLSNFQQNVAALLLLRTSYLMPILLLAPVLLDMGLRVRALSQGRPRAALASLARAARDQVRAPGQEARRCYFSGFLVITLAAYFALLLVSGTQALRYSYPMVFLLALLVGLSVIGLIARGPAFPGFWRWITLSACCLFVSTNYYNFLCQFASQSLTRNCEERLLAATAGLLGQGNRVSLVVESEYEDKIRLYFNEYLPRFHRTGYRLTIAKSPTELRSGEYWLSRSRPGVDSSTVFARFQNDPADPFLDAVAFVSRALQFGRGPYSWVDAGATSLIGNQWFIMKNDPRAHGGWLSPRSEAMVMSKRNDESDRAASSAPWGAFRVARHFARKDAAPVE